MNQFRRVFAAVYWLLVAVIAVVALASLIMGGSSSWLGTLLAAVAPLANRIFPFDALIVPYHKVRRPKVSFCVLAGLAWVLLTSTGSGPDLWLALLAVGGFLLVTYWAEEEPSSSSS